MAQRPVSEYSGSPSTLQPPLSPSGLNKSFGGSGNGAHLRASADFSGLTSPAMRGRPSSEILAMQQGGVNYTSPEAEALDKWIEDLQHYEATLEEMAAASLDPSFKDELNAIEQWFRVLSEAERTAALYSLIQQSTQVQIRFFITVLQQMARSDPMTALLSPSNPEKPNMETQMASAMAMAKMESDIANLSLQSSSSTGSARLLGQDDAAVALAQQRARFKAGAPQHLSSGMYTNTSKSVDIHSPMWSQSLGSAQSFGASVRSPRVGAMDGAELSPMMSGNWASMVNTPIVPMFTPDKMSARSQDVDLASMKLAQWQMNRSGLTHSTATNVMLDDPRKYRRKSGNSQPGQQIMIGTYDENGNLVIPQHQQQRRSSRGSTGRSSSPVPPGLYNNQQQYGMSNGQLLSAASFDSGHYSDHSDGGSARNSKKKSSNKGDEPVDLALLEDIPAWLRTLRLHKYTPNFENMTWQDIIKLSDEDLEGKGIAALGARRKLLKVFDQIQKQLNGEPPSTATSVTTPATATTPATTPAPSVS